MNFFQAIIELMFKKAVTEPHYCETYADMVFNLKVRMINGMIVVGVVVVVVVVVVLQIHAGKKSPTELCDIPVQSTRMNDYQGVRDDRMCLRFIVAAILCVILPLFSSIVTLETTVPRPSRFPFTCFRFGPSSVDRSWILQS